LRAKTWNFFQKNMDLPTLYSCHFSPKFTERSRFPSRKFDPGVPDPGHCPVIVI